VTKAEIRQKLLDKGCLYSPEQGYHFVGISGKHLSGYCNIDPALPDVEFISQLTRQLVEPFADQPIDTVLAPAIGAIPLAQWGPHFLKQITGRTVQGVWADKVKPRGFVIERAGFADAIIGKQVLILEDMVNQMFSVTELRKLVDSLGGHTIGVGALVANDTATADKIGTKKFVSLCDFSYDAWEPDRCELCAKDIPIVTDPALGHGDGFQKSHPNYAGGFLASIQ
jgi:orotate phosphoribosyltransferase